MKYALCLAVAAACFFLARWTLDIDLVQKSRLLRPSEPCQTGNHLAPSTVWVASGVLGLCGGATMWRILARAQDVVTVLALVIALLCLTGSACVDFIEHRIPNLFPGVLAVGALILLFGSMAVGRDGAVSNMVSALLSCAGCALALVIASFLSSGGIGAGDIKLVSALALMCGVYVICRTLLFGMAACALTACALLVTKKKSKKDTLPFAPFLLLGFALGLWITLI